MAKKFFGTVKEAPHVPGGRRLTGQVVQRGEAPRVTELGRDRDAPAGIHQEDA